MLVGIPLLAQETTLELGGGVVWMSYPSYIGSNQQEQLLVPVPDLSYTSPVTTINKNGIKQQLFDRDDLSLDLSLGGSLPVNSQNDPTRAGMPDLDLALEFGPRLNYQLYKNQTHHLNLRLPLRMVLTTDLRSIDYQGYLLSPNLKYQYRHQGLKFSYQTGPLWADQTYNDYFYGVSPIYTTPQRHAYQASSGYSGYQNSISLEQRFGAWRGGIFLSHFDLHGVTFENSPLLSKKEALFVGSFLSYIFYTQ